MSRERSSAASRGALTGAVAVAPAPQAAIAAMFFAFGVGLGFWSGASAAIVARVGIGAATFGVALTAFTGAYLAAMSAAGALARRFSVKRTLIAAAVAMAPTLAALLLAGDIVALFGLLIAYGFTAGLVDLTMNAAGARAERRLGRPILARLHGGASAGLAVGAVGGSLLATSATPWASGVIVVFAAFAASALIAVALPDDRGEAVGAASIGGARLLSRTLVVLGLVVGVSLACESAALSWSALILRREAPQWAALSGLGAAFFAACQASLRFNADRLRARLDDRQLILISFAVAAAGFLIVAADASFATGVAGFATIGFGTGAVVPCGFALAATRPGVSAAAGLSTAAFFGSFARLPAPLAAGAVADAFSLASAFALFAGLIAVAFAATLVLIPAPSRAPSS